MAVTSAAEGTQNTNVGSEDSLSAQTNAGTYVLKLNVSNLAADEVLEVRLKEKVLTGDSVAVVYFASLVGPFGADDTVQCSLPVMSPYGVTATIKQLNGSTRAVKWQLSYAS